MSLDLSKSATGKGSAAIGFAYERRVAYHETDSMGVVHHSNHIKFFEEARVAWLRETGLIEVHAPLGPYTFAVVSLDARYMKTAQFEDLLKIRVETRLEGLRIIFRYAIWNERTAQWIAEGNTTLVPLGPELRPVRLTREIQDLFAHVPWSESWPPAPLKSIVG